MREQLTQGKIASAKFEYLPYGEMRPGFQMGLPNRGFTGHQADYATGAYFAPFRYYNVTTSRWMSRDPLGFGDGLNRYAYAAGDPASGYDPLGLEREETAGERAQRKRECVKWEKKIQKLIEELGQRIDDFLRNEGPHGQDPLPWACEGDDKKPSRSRRMHLDMINKAFQYLDRARAEYTKRRCDDFKQNQPVEQEAPEVIIPAPAPQAQETPSLAPLPTVQPSFIPVPIPIKPTSRAGIGGPVSSLQHCPGFVAEVLF